MVISEYSSTAYRQIIDTVQEAVFIVNGNEEIEYANKMASDFLKVSNDELIGTCFNDFIDGFISDNQCRFYRKGNNNQFYGQIVRYNLYENHDCIIVSECNKKLHLMASVFESTKEAAIILDSKGIALLINQSFTEITGYQLNDIIGTFPKMLVSELQNDVFYQSIRDHLSLNGYWKGEVVNYRKNGELCSILLTISQIVDDDSHYYVAMFSDITSIKEREKNLEKMVQLSSVFPNRQMVIESIKLFTRDIRYDGVSILCVDVVGAIDVYGTSVKFKLLSIIKERLERLLSASDQLLKLDNELFILMCEGLDVTDLITSVIESVNLPIELNQQLLSFTCNVGVRLVKKSETINGDELLRQVEQTMVRASLDGKNTFAYFDVKQNEVLQHRLMMQEEIKKGLENNEFILYYQPKVHMKEGKIEGFEALVRWNHPTRGILAPGVFLEYVENNPLSLLFDDYVFRKVLQQMSEWLPHNIEVSINISATTLEQSNFIDHLVELLQLYPPINPNNICIELLESTSINNIEYVTTLIQQMKVLGVKVALDDFGTGYSSLTYLRLLPVDIVKIDQSFVKEVIIRPNDFIILEGVVNLSRSFNRMIIAEGVETLEHERLLMRLGVQRIQGYSVSRPIPSDKVIPFVLSFTPHKEWQQIKSIDRIYFPALLSEIEHRAWANMVEFSLSTSKLNPTVCRFHQWLHNELERSSDKREQLMKLEDYHQFVHQQALSYSQGIISIEAFKEASNALLAHLEAFFDKL